MRWLRRSSEPPQLLGLSPLRTEDSFTSLTTVDHNEKKIQRETVSDVFRNRTPNQSTRKSRIDQSTPQTSPSTPSWSKKFTKSTENCYNIQEGRVIERGLKGRYISPVRIKNKNNSSIRSSSPSQSIASIRSITNRTPTHQSLHNVNFVNENNNNTLNWRVLQRERVTADVDATDKGDEKDFEGDRVQRKKNEFHRVTGYSVPYREKRNVLSSTRLSCYKPATNDKKFDISSLKNYKSVDDFLSLDKTDATESNDADDLMVSMPFIKSSKDLRLNFEESQETPKMSQQPPESSESMQRMKKAGISSKLRSMSDKTHKLFSKFYSNSAIKTNNNSSTDVCSDFIIQRPVKSIQPSNIASSRRSLSYGMLPGINEFEIKKIETEDGDSGILVNESGASSMVETDSSSEEPKTEIEAMECQREEEEGTKSEETLRITTSHTISIDDSQPQPKSEIFDLSACRHSSSSDQILSPTSSSSFVTKRLRNLSMDGLNERSSSDDSAPKRNSIVLEIVAMIEKNETKFNTMKNPRRSKPFSKQNSPEPSAISTTNLCDDDKLKLKSLSKEKICDSSVEPTVIAIDDDMAMKMKTTSNFCTLPRRTKASTHCTFLTVAFEKGPGKKSLGFTIVGGADSPRGALGIFIKSIMPNGQAIESGQLRAGDEILAVNGQVCHDLTHQDAVRLFKSVRSGEVVLNICRRKNNLN